jgi:hypothetical protein
MGQLVPQWSSSFERCAEVQLCRVGVGMSEDMPKYLVYHCFEDCSLHWKGSLSWCKGVVNNWMVVCGPHW